MLVLVKLPYRKEQDWIQKKTLKTQEMILMLNWRKMNMILSLMMTLMTVEGRGVD